MLPDETKTDAFTLFVSQVEDKLRFALTAALGTEYGREAAAEALAYGWEHWDRVREADNPAGYLYRVGLNHGKKPRSREQQRVTVFLVHGHEWSMTEVAILLGVSKGTVQKHLERGMEKLRRKLGVTL